MNQTCSAPKPMPDVATREIESAMSALSEATQKVEALGGLISAISIRYVGHECPPHDVAGKPETICCEIYQIADTLSRCAERYRDTLNLL